MKDEGGYFDPDKYIIEAKMLSIENVLLTDEELEDKCETCLLNKMQDCRIVKSWLVCSHGFMACELGYNYQKRDR